MTTATLIIIAMVFSSTTGGAHVTIEQVSMQNVRACELAAAQVRRPLTKHRSHVIVGYEVVRAHCVAGRLI